MKHWQTRCDFTTAGNETFVLALQRRRFVSRTVEHDPYWLAVFAVPESKSETRNAERLASK